MSWAKLFVQALPILWGIMKFLINRHDNRKLKEAVREEFRKRVKVERDAGLRDRANDDLDERRRRAGWTGDGHEE